MTIAKPGQAYLEVHWKDSTETLPCQYNPTELSFEKSAQLAEIALPGLSAPLQQFVRGQAETLNVELFFDTSDQGMGAQAVSVTTLTDKIYALTKIEPTAHTPPFIKLFWGAGFPGQNLPEKVSGQRRDSFQGVVASVRQSFTLWSSLGVPLRAKLSLTIKEYAPLDDQLRRLNPSSPDRTHSHIVTRGETLAAIAGRYYNRVGEWRQIADANGIEDPRRIAPGRQLSVPAILPGGG